jgi:hypothetical protein
VRKTFSASSLPLCVLCVLGLIGCSANGLTTDLTGEQAAATPATQPTEHSNGIVQDWSTSHTLYPRVGEINALLAVQKDPRAILSWQEAERQDFIRARGPRRFLNPPSEINRDWSISLGTGGVAPSMYPAKFTFSITAAPTCTAVSPAVPDYAVFPIDVAGSVTQPNIVAFNNLYSGTVPTNGICNRTPSGSDTGVAATTFWSYNITAAGGVVATSPALSLDGTKVAFVETGSATTAHFHVLAGKSGDGVNAANLQSVASPVSITSGFSATTPAAGAVTDLALATGTTQSDTLSSPFVDYTNDLAYVGNDSGVLFRIQNVFCTTTACTGGGSPAPSLDTTWGSSGALTIGGTCTGKLSGAVVDGGTGNIFVGCADGKIYGYTSAGVALTNPSVTIGNGAATGGIVDPPMVDAVNHFLYGVSGASSGGTSVLVQASTTNLGSVVTATLGAGGAHSLHAPAFNSGYFSSVNPTHWLIYEWALSAAGTNIELYGPTFTAGHVMNGGTPANTIQVGGSTSVEFSPLTEILNGANDQVFVSGITLATPNFVEYDMNAFLALFPTSFPPTGVTGATTSESGGTSGMVVDNTSGSAQASSIYFGNLGSNTAVKLTQSGLN